MQSALLLGAILLAGCAAQGPASKDPSASPLHDRLQPICETQFIPAGNPGRWTVDCR
jgi:hypothetical protein